MREYEFHEAANIFPLAKGKEFRALVNSMQRHGFQAEHAIQLSQGKIVDGRNRYRAAKEAGVKPVFAQRSDGANPFDFTWRENGARRHLDAGTMASCFLEYLSRSNRWETEQEARRNDANQKRSRIVKGLQYPGEGESPVSGDTGLSKLNGRLITPA
jgi:ParB-like chromosome segregation protein Spo0J